MTAPDNAELGTLIAAVARHEHFALKRLYALVAPKLLAIVLRILRDRAMAEDVMQDIFMGIWQNAATFSPVTGSAWAWLVSIAHHRAIDILRLKGPAHASHEMDAVDYYEKMSASADPEMGMTELAPLRNCLGKLDEPTRACVLLAYYEGYSREDLARRFAQPETTIKTWLTGSLTALKTCLEKQA